MKSHRPSCFILLILSILYSLRGMDIRPNDEAVNNSKHFQSPNHEKKSPKQLKDKQQKNHASAEVFNMLVQAMEDRKKDGTRRKDTDQTAQSISKPSALALTNNHPKTASHAGRIISEYECKGTEDEDTLRQCSIQFDGAERFFPSNETIFQVFPSLPDKDTKYFHEAKNDMHRDRRFYKNKYGGVDVEKRRVGLRNLFVEWNQFTAEHNLTSWIAHGLLIGYYWNNDLLPWDLDLDVQVLAHDLLAGFAALSGTRYRGRYLLDINPHSKHRLHQKDNVIDGRFVDTRNGLYLDITGLAYSPRHERLQCKSVHNYHPHAIFPLRRSVFCGVAVWVPNKVESTLNKEYGMKSMRNTLYKVKINGRLESYKFDPTDRRWIMV